MSETARPPTAPFPTTASRTSSRVLWAAAAWSAVHLLLAGRWLLSPGSRPGLEGGDENAGSGLLTVLPATLTAWLVLTLAGGGLAVTLAAALRRPSTATVVGAAAVAAGLAVLAADMRALVLLGYLVAIVAPAAFVVVFTIGALRSRRTRPWLAGVAVLVAAGVWSGLLAPDTIGRLAVDLRGPLAAELPSRSHLALLLAGVVLFAGLAVLVRRAASGSCAACGRPGARWTRPEAVARWGRSATLVAAAAPLPYVLMRMTWLTPWPVALPAEDGSALRLFGLALGAAALGGAVLTVGLIRPWGEVWPSWVPVVRGRPVPRLLPVVAGGLVAVVLLAASPAMLAIGVDGLLSAAWREAWFLVLFPTLPWGLALAGAVTAYALRRRGACAACGEGTLLRSARP